MYYVSAVQEKKMKVTLCAKYSTKYREPRASQTKYNQEVDQDFALFQTNRLTQGKPTGWSVLMGHCASCDLAS